MATFTSPCTPGNLLVASFQNEASAWSGAIGDSASQTYGLLAHQLSAGNSNLWSLENASATALTITVTSTAFGVLIISEWNPNGGTISLDGTPVANSGTSTSPTSGNVTITGGDLFIGMIAPNNSTLTSTFSTVQNVPFSSGHNIASGMFFSLSQAGPTAAITGTVSPSVLWGAVAAAWLSTGGGAKVVPYRQLFGGMNYSLMDTP